MQNPLLERTGKLMGHKPDGITEAYWLGTLSEILSVIAERDRLRSFAAEVLEERDRLREAVEELKAMNVPSKPPVGNPSSWEVMAWQSANIEWRAQRDAITKKHNL